MMDTANFWEIMQQHAISHASIFGTMIAVMKRRDCIENG